MQSTIAFPPPLNLSVPSVFQPSRALHARLLIKKPNPSPRSETNSLYVLRTTPLDDTRRLREASLRRGEGTGLGAARQRPRPDSGRRWEGAGLDLKLFTRGAALQKKSILILNLKLPSFQPGGGVCCFFKFFFTKPNYFLFKPKSCFHIRGRGVIRPTLINPPFFAAVPEATPGIQHPNEDTAMERGGGGSQLLPPSLATANVVGTSSTHPGFPVLFKSSDKKHFLPPKDRLQPANRCLTRGLRSQNHSAQSLAP